MGDTDIVTVNDYLRNCMYPISNNLVFDDIGVIFECYSSQCKDLLNTAVLCQYH